MFLSLSSLISVVFFSSLLIVLLWCCLRDIQRTAKIGVRGILIFMGLILIRLVFPFEFSFSVSVASSRFMPWFMDILHAPVVSIESVTITILQVILILWTVGSVIYTAITLKTYLRFRRTINLLPAFSNPEAEEILHNIVAEHKKIVDFKLVCADFISTPMLFGYRHPKILIPAVDLTSREWYLILKHETAHYYNQDLAIKLFVQLLQIIYWWNPFVHLFSNEVDRMLEFRADSKVTETMTEHEKLDYLDCLLKVAKGFAVEKRKHYLIAFENEKASVLTQRFHLLLGIKDPAHGKGSPVIVFLLVLLLYFSLITVFEPYAIKPEDAEGTFELTIDNSYLVVNPEGGYDVYLDGTFVGTAQEIQDSFSDLTVYQTLEEALENED